MTKGSIGSPIGILISVFLVCSSCNQISHSIEPKVSYSVQDTYLKNLPSPFSPLSEDKSDADWGREYRIGLGFARSLDFYRAITAFRRAEILLPKEEKTLLLQIQYEILLCYYLGKKYLEVEETFAQSGLSQVDENFPAYRDLLIILYDTYIHLKEMDRAGQILQLLNQTDPKTAEILLLSSLLEKGDITSVEEMLASTHAFPTLTEMLHRYQTLSKSPQKAAILNACLPGAGYFYLGQTQTGVTALLVNGLFIATSVYFFVQGPITAALITTGFEVGWYVGGIQGGISQGRLYNERLYEQLLTPLMNKEKLFPIYQLHYAF